MPPVRANGNGPPVGAPNPGNGQSQLNPAQLAQLHEYIRQKRQANGGGDITAAMVTDWMRANQLGPGVGLGGAGAGAAGFPPQLNQQLDPSQQQQLLIAQRQHMLIAHLFPPHLANNQNPAGALQHLQAVLFPPQNLGQPPAQNPLLSQVLTLAQAQRLSPEQMQLLRTAVASRNPPQPPPQQSHPQNSGQQYTAQQQAAMQAHQQQVMAAQAAQAASAHQNQALPPSLPPQQQHQQQQQQGQQPSTAGSEAQHLVVTLQHRVASIENLLKRPDLQGDHRQKAQAELKASQAQLQQVVKGFLAQHPQAPGAAADLQQAQRTIADTLGFGARKKEEGGTGKVKDPRGEEGSKGRTGQKRKIRELVEQVDPEEVLDPEVEDLLLDIADEFIDSMTRFACQLAKHRKSDRLEVKDLALHLDRSYNMKVPGFGPEETRSSQTRRINLPPGYQGRLAAVREASSRGR
ncbi:hypothetical protein RQP46_011015 [Phenoliferia psychrophenolica]